MSFGCFSFFVFLGFIEVFAGKVQCGPIPSVISRIVTPLTPVTY